MTYAKMTGGQPVPLRLPLKDGRNDIFTNDPEVLARFGYLPVTVTEPGDAPAGWHFELSYTETETEIRTVWTLAEDEADAEDFENALKAMNIG